MAISPLEVKMSWSAESLNVFEMGKYDVNQITVPSSSSSKPPTELFIVTPVTKGSYPVLLFCHGFMLSNTWYTSLLKHIASHGYVVVAPKFYGFPWISMSDEVKKAAKVSQWLATGLPLILPTDVNPDISNLALSGHSRGGKTAFALALHKLENKSHKNKKLSDNLDLPKFKALIGIDPVAGPSPSEREPPIILEYKPQCFNMSVPVALIGTGYGDQWKFLIPPFAPDGVNYAEFFKECRPPVCSFLAKNFGHCDMLDDGPATFFSMFCKSCAWNRRDLMRKSCGGIVVSFLQAYLGGDGKDLDAIVDDPSIAPILLDPVIYVKD